MMDYAPPPSAPHCLAQEFNDTGSSFDLLRTSRQSTTTPNTQRPIETLGIQFYLSSKFIGVVSPFTNENKVVLGRGIVTRVVKDENGYICLMYNPQARSEIELRVVFEGQIQDAPTQKRKEMSVSSQIHNKRMLEAETQLSTMASGIGAESTTVAINPGDRLPEPTPDILPEGEVLNVIDLKTSKLTRQSVVIYKGYPFLSNGVPITIRLEYQP